MGARSAMLLALLLALLPAAAPVEMEDGVWAAPGVVQENLSGGGRAFEIVPGQKVVVIPLPAGRHARALAQLGHCATGWQKLYATAAELEEERHNCYRCVPRPRAATAALREFNEDAATRSALREALNITAPCVDVRTGDFLSEAITRTSIARQWLTALTAGMPPDAWHPDGCDLNVRRSGWDFFTVLTYPNAEWKDEWGGQVEFGAATCDDPRQETWSLAPVLRVTPGPDVLIFFSGALIHRATNPNMQAPLLDGPPDLTSGGRQKKWRYSNVMQITCENHRYHGPYYMVMWDHFLVRWCHGGLYLLLFFPALLIAFLAYPYPVLRLISFLSDARRQVRPAAKMV